VTVPPGRLATSDPTPGLNKGSTTHVSPPSPGQTNLIPPRDMELVTRQDDFQAVEDFCSGCQFIGLRNGSLRVLRLLNEAHWRRLPQTFQRT
ncbi:hypothetical protein RRG08_059063, partial [Elysia crispata]